MTNTLLNGFLIAGTASGVGKTTVTLAIIAAMRRRGLVVQPFKSGPDFLDAGHQTQVSGRVARNLDTWMLNAEANIEALEHAIHGADLLLVEGMMGLFDGIDGATETGSSAEIAKLLKLPVVLVLDVSKSSRSVAAVIKGFEAFDTELTLCGVILNRAANEGHFRMLKTAIVSACDTPVLGWLPREPAIAISERHLGLQNAEETEGEADQRNDTLARLAEAHLDLGRILSFECRLEPSPSQTHAATKSDQPIRIGVALDRAFSFYYEDNFDLLRQSGATIIPFSPLSDTTLPEDLQALYLGGGYPELYVQQLSSNKSMLAAIRDFTSSGRAVYAECGGMMYLSEEIRCQNEQAYPMVGFLPYQIEMTNRLVDFGYVTAELLRDSLLGPRGTTVRGHSFHYSRIRNAARQSPAYQIKYSLSGRIQEEGYAEGNVLASYIHLHFRAHPQLAQNFVAAAREAKTKDMVHG